MFDMRCIISIAGSDSGGGAGIQADLKTFAALGVHGTCAITAITAQNTLGVQKIHDLPIEVVMDQIDSIVSDFSVDYAKTGMLYSKEVVRAVAKKMRKYNIPLVVDPLMRAGAGGSLIRGSRELDPGDPPPVCERFFVKTSSSADFPHAAAAVPA